MSIATIALFFSNYGNKLHFLFEKFIIRGDKNDYHLFFTILQKCYFFNIVSVHNKTSKNE